MNLNIRSHSQLYIVGQSKKFILTNDKKYLFVQSLNKNYLIMDEMRVCVKNVHVSFDNQKFDRCFEGIIAEPKSFVMMIHEKSNCVFDRDCFDLSME